VKTLGRHVLVELYECHPDFLNDIELVKDAMLEGARKAKLTIVDSIFHKFAPHGVSGVVVISESHLAIHTWPEYGYAALDFFTCGPDTDPWIAQGYVTAGFKAKKVTCMELKRGLVSTFPEPSPPTLARGNQSEDHVPRRREGTLV